MTAGLTQEQKLSLVHECTDASALFTRGLDMLASVRDDDTGTVAVMSLLALGAEKMLKLTIGLTEVDQGRSWPSKFEMQSLGHRIMAADRTARPLVRRLPGTVSRHTAELETRVDADTVLPVVLKALDCFGSAGRFYHLDVLAESRQPEPSPRHLWHDATAAVMKKDSGLGAAIDGTTDLALARRRWNNTMVTSLRTWWEKYYAAWRSGVIGNLTHPIFR